MLSFLLGKKEENTLNSIWEKIIKNIKNKKQITELNDNLKAFYKLIKEKLKFSNKSQNYNINESEKLLFLKEGDILTKMCEFPITYPESSPITLEYLSLFLNILKYQKFLFNDNENLFKSLQNLVLNLEEDLEKKKHKFILKNEFAYLLNSITRIILNYPSFISFFFAKLKNDSNEEYNDYTIFSSLLKLLEIEQNINNYTYKKYIRRSLIVSLSFDDINKDDYLFNNSFVVEILINKLCYYYKILPKSFDIDKNSKTLDPNLNISINNNNSKALYPKYKDYIIFLNKIINCFTDEKIKNKIKNYFFNKFLVENVMPNLLKENIKIIRTNLQYLITLLNLSKNNAIIINAISYFLFGITDNNNDNNITVNKSEIDNNLDINSNIENSNENNDEKNSIKEDTIYLNYLESNYDPEKIKNILLFNMHKKIDYLNIVIYELYNILFQKKPYLMIKQFIKPYTDLVISKSNNKTKFILETETSYPMSSQLMDLLNKINSYEIYSNMENNIESSLFKNLCFYINFDIDFYNYYLNNKKKEDLLLNQSSQSTNNNNEMSSFRINEDSFSEKSSNTDTLEDNIIKGLNPNYIKTLLTSKDKKSNKKKENTKNKDKINHNENDIIVKDIFGNEKYIKEEEDNEINNNINNVYFGKDNKNKIKENILKDENKNILFMKNIHHKLVNFENNTNVENIILFHLIITIISIPNFSFDTDLLRSNLVLLDNDEKSKYSIMTIFKYHSQNIIKNLLILENENKFKLVLKEFHLNNNLNSSKNNSIKEKNNIKIGLDFKGFNINQRMNENDKDKNKIINWLIFYEFIKEVIACISHKYKFEDLIEHLFVFYSEQLDEFYNDNISEEEEDEENEERGEEIDNEKNYQLKDQNLYSKINSNNMEFDE